MKSSLSTLLLSALLAIPLRSTAEVPGSEAVDLDLNVEAMVTDIRKEPELTARMTKAADMSFVLLSLPKSGLDRLSCPAIKTILTEFDAQPAPVRIYFARVLAAIGGRARSALPAMRDALAEEQALNVPNQLGTYPSVTFVSDYTTSIERIEADQRGTECR